MPLTLGYHFALQSYYTQRPQVVHWTYYEHVNIWCEQVRKHAAACSKHAMSMCWTLPPPHTGQTQHPPHSRRCTAVQIMHWDMTYTATTRKRVVSLWKPVLTRFNVNWILWGDYWWVAGWSQRISSMGVSSKLITNHNHQRTDTFIKKPAVYLQSQLVIASCMQCVWYVQAPVESVQLCVRPNIAGL